MGYNLYNTNNTNKQPSKDTSDRVPLTITYNPPLPNAQDILRKKQPILHSTERLKIIFILSSLSGADLGVVRVVRSKPLN